jgi:DNA-binding MarR family transcriptional regulator
MSDSSQDAFGESSGSNGSDGPAFDPISAVEGALGALRGRGHGGPFGGAVHHESRGGRRRGDHGSHGGRSGGGAHDGPGGRGGHAALRLLLALETRGPSSVSELAEAIGVDQPRASRLAQAAVDAGHVRRDVDPGDARRSILVITEAGRRTLSDVLDRRRSAIEQAMAGFTPHEREQFARLFARFAEAWLRQ